MKKIISLSLPQKIADEIKKETKKNGYISQSEFFRDIYRQRKENSFIPQLELVPKEKITKEMRKKIKETKMLKRSELLNI